MALMSLRTLTASLVAAAALQLASAAQTLGLGDKAPPIKVAAFLQGDPVTAFEKGKPYVVEFWATWCPPCIKSIPHINSLAAKYKQQGLTVIGVDIWENDPPKVEAFVKKMGADMTYTVARDQLQPDDVKGETGFMVKNWMQPAGLGGIPSAFIIDREGVVVWIGHPTEMDKPLAEVMAGTWTVDKARAEIARAKELEALQAPLFERLKAAFAAQDFALGLVVLDELIALDPQFAIDYAPLRFDVMLRTKDLDKAYAYARGLHDGLLKDDGANLNQLAWIIVDPESIHITRRDLELAALLAKRADTLAEGKDAGTKDTLARIAFHKGDLEQAIELQQKAIELADNPKTKSQLSEVLAEYRAALAARG